MRSDAKENKKEIIRCAKQLFAERGVTNVSMNLIAKTLNIGAGTLYRHYPNKSALCMALVYGELANFIENSTRILDLNEASPKVQFEAILENYLQFREANAELLVNVDIGNKSTTGSYFYVSNIYPSLVAVFSQAIQAASPNLTDRTCQFRADMLIAMLKSDAYAYQRQVRGRNPHQLTKEIAMLFLE